MIVVDQVSKGFVGGAGAVAALAGVSLRVAAGELVALIGPSGCGKSTLLRMVAGLIDPDSGTIQIDGQMPHALIRQRRMALVFQAPVLFPWLTVEANIAMPLELMGLPRATRQARTAELLRLVGLDGFAAALPNQLSGGMQQRAAIARALSTDPAVLLLDEPFSALDELTREHLQSELLNIRAAAGRNTAALFVTHNITEAVFLADRVAVMSTRPGRVVREIAIDLARPRTPEIRDDLRFHALEREIRSTLRQSG